MSTKPKIKEPCCRVCLFSRTNESYTTDEKKIYCHACPPHELRNKEYQPAEVASGNICCLFQMKTGARRSKEDYEKLKRLLRLAKAERDTWYREHLAYIVAIKSQNDKWIPNEILNTRDRALLLSTKELSKAAVDGVLVDGDV